MEITRSLATRRGLSRCLDEAETLLAADLPILDVEGVPRRDQVLPQVGECDTQVVGGDLLTLRQEAALLDEALQVVIGGVASGRHHLVQGEIDDGLDRRLTQEKRRLVARHPADDFDRRTPEGPANRREMLFTAADEVNDGLHAVTRFFIQATFVPNGADRAAEDRAVGLEPDLTECRIPRPDTDSRLIIFIIRPGRRR